MEDRLLSRLRGRLRFVHKAAEPLNRNTIEAPNPEPVAPSGSHPIFEKIVPYRGPKPSDCLMERDGSLFVQDCLQQLSEPFRTDFLRGNGDILKAADDLEIPWQPALERDHECFEWIDLLESVALARESFTFVELGAGYGRWSIRAYHAARTHGLRSDQIRLVTVEAEPLHSTWLMQNMSLNGIGDGTHWHFEGAVSDFDGQAEFMVLQPGEVDRQKQAREWYGQSLLREDNRWEGVGTEHVQVARLRNILSELPAESVIDLVDMDLQGEESRVLKDSTDVLERVKRLHIGTDTPEEEHAIFETLTGAGWKLLRYYPCKTSVTTTYGDISFVDGVMSWLNPTYM